MREQDRRLAALAAAQENLFTRAQFLDCGLGPRALEHRVAAGHLQRVFPCVYLLGSAPPTMAQKLRAGLLLGGESSLFSHRTAAWLRRMQREPPGLIDLLVTDGRPRAQPALRIHRTLWLDPVDRTALEHLRLTSAIRTLCDLAASEPVALVHEALTEALARGLLPRPELEALDGRLRRHPGAACLRTLVAAESEHGYSRSEAERRLRKLLKPSGLPMPRFNVQVNEHLVDCHWAQFRVVLEVDGYATHRDRRSFEADRRRDQDHAARGYLVVRVTWRQLTREPARVLVRIAETLAMARLAH